VERDAVGQLATSLRGELLTKSSPEYDAARTLWNGMIDRRPAFIARCRSAADVIRGVTFAREHGMPLAIRGGGHNVAGNALCDDGLVIDLSPMKSVRVDPRRRTARVEPGVTLGELDHDTQAFGLATPLGINSTTGVAGLTLGGGFGWLSRRFGLAADNLLSADVVTANGELVTASEDEHPDLFWAIRGGGGNFGVVTSFEFQLHEVGPEVLAGIVVHPFDRAPELLRRYRDVAASAPEEVTAWVVLRTVPPLPTIPKEAHGTNMVGIAMIHSGRREESERTLKPLRSIGQPMADMVVLQPYTAYQRALDPLLTPGARNYWKSHNFTELSDELIDTLVDAARQLPDPQCEIALAQLGGATSRVKPDATAYTHRDAAFVMNVHGRWSDPSRDGDCIAWARSLFDATTPFATGGVYVNFLTADESDRVRAAYGANYQRLAETKARYDPDNLFRQNQNIRPAARA
jgi:FAD/FMN-containing dehydrogenase